jgi:hypothetical protein
MQTLWNGWYPNKWRWRLHIIMLVTSCVVTKKLAGEARPDPEENEWIMDLGLTRTTSTGECMYYLVPLYLARVSHHQSDHPIRSTTKSVAGRESERSRYKTSAERRVAFGSSFPCTTWGQLQTTYNLSAFVEISLVVTFSQFSLLE